MNESRVLSNQDKREMNLAITQITIAGSNGSATANVCNTTLESNLDKPVTIVLQAVFTISEFKRLSGSDFSHHIPGCTVEQPRFVHMSIISKTIEGNEEQFDQAQWPQKKECEETFLAAIACMLTYTNQLIPF
ncbi:hypothetical protein [Massilia varians]|jgi:hypothetical protein|uniref:hypothetical protein n=1 Tax=Massilia varians TaxID=457921 RepID=UPI002556E7E6|nr:hypothetical protein [Massilia varians]MDK6080186.1 hypothetical protein [Massilia varians]